MKGQGYASIYMTHVHIADFLRRKCGYFNDKLLFDKSLAFPSTEILLNLTFLSSSILLSTYL